MNIFILMTSKIS